MSDNKKRTGKRVSCAMGRPPSAPIEERFWSRVDKNGPTMPHMDTPCWQWIGAKGPKGYGCFDCHLGQRAHRVSLKLSGVVVPDDVLVLHLCDNRGCVRPSHLRLGSHADNMRDREARGRTARGAILAGRCPPERQARGSATRSSKVSEVDVIAIRTDHRDGASLPVISKRFGLSVSQCHRIVHRLSWAHVADPVVTGRDA